ncbi:MAG: hypothetical protein KGL95_03715 [Patescibacteria group bacterium]|nr:hypothetical protein [Patescibacteria group bacterium]
MKKAKEHKTIVDNPETGEETTLLTTIEDVEKIANKKIIRGTIKYDDLIPIKQRNQPTKYIQTMIPVRFSFLFGSLYFIVHDRDVADATSDRVSKIIMRGIPDSILKCYISPENIDRFLATHAHVLTDTSIGEVTIPRFSATRFQGSEFDLTPQYQDFKRHGRTRSARFRLRRYDWSISMNRNACVTFFSTVTEEQMEDFMRKEIIPICN